MLGIGVRADGKAVAKSLTLLGSVLSALAGGTNYVFSAYAPQLGSRLHIDHTRLNMIALAGNVGMYGTGPGWGAIADSWGPKPLYVIATSMLFTGYMGIKLFYDGVFKLPTGAAHKSSFAFFVLILFAFLTGAGGSAGITGSVNAVARSFSDARRSTAVGFVVSGFGLSAFFFSTIAHTAFADNTSAFLAILALGTTVPNVLAYFLVRVVHDDERPERGKEQRAGYAIISDDGDDGSPVYLERRLNELDEERRNSDSARLHESTSSLPLPSRNHHNITPERRHPDGTRGRSSIERIQSRSLASSLDLPSEFGNTATSAAEIPRMALTLELEDIPENPRNSSTPDMNRSNGLGGDDPLASGMKDPESIPALLKRGDFWLMCGVVTLLAGTGLMWINNVGSIAQALVAQGKPDTWDKARAAKVQAAQVSVISVMNCLGRLIIGIITDHAKHSFGIRRCFWLIPVSLLFIISQTLARNTTTPDMLWVSSASIGMSYGAMFSLVPMIIIEWFGLARFSRNWGMVAISPAIGGNIFSLAFGMNLDQHASLPASGVESIMHRDSVPRGGLPDSTDHLCFDGLECYQSSLEMTILATVAAALLSTFAFWRDRHIYAARDRSITRALEPQNSDNRRNQAHHTDPIEEERLLSSHS